MHSGTEIITRIEFEGLTADSEVQLVYEQANDQGGYIWESDLIGRQVISDGHDWAVLHFELKPNEIPITENVSLVSERRRISIKRNESVEALETQSNQKDIV